MENHTNISSNLRTRSILVGLLAISGVYLVANHGEHVAPYLPFTFLLGCIFMHFFEHGRRGEHGADTHKKHHEQKTL